MFRRAKMKHDDDDYKTAGTEGASTGEANYYMQAHSIKEVVNDQPTIMVNGKLKEYQVSLFLISATNHPPLLALFVINSQTLENRGRQ